MGNRSPEHIAFLASRMDANRPLLNSLRRRIHELGTEIGRPVWVAERDAQELDRQLPQAVQAACLRKVLELPVFICVIDGSYGTPWNDAGLCVLELEIMTAAVARKPLHFFLLEPYSRTDPEIDSLLHVIRIAVGTSIDLQPKSADQIVGELRKRLRLRKRTFLGSPPVRRAAKMLIELGSLDIHFLDSRFSPLNSGRPDPELIDRLLQTAASGDAEAPLRLINVWMAIRHLFGAPYTDPNFTDFLPLWERALEIWASTSAWYGLHGHHYLGRLAAVNSLLFIRRQQAALGAVASQHSIQGTRGAVASEYLSIAKTVGSRHLRRTLLRRALENVDAALSTAGPDPSGLFGIRGTILQNLGRKKAGVRDYERMLQIRMNAKESAGRIGEAEVELGFGLLRTWRPALAERFILGGIRRLEASDRHPFTVRALRKLAAFYVVTLRPFKARNAIDRAHAIAKRYDLQDQLRQIRSTRAILGWVPARKPKEPATVQSD